MTARALLMPVVSLLALAAFGSAIVATTWSVSHERIAGNREQALLDRLHQLQPPSSHDNRIARDRIALALELPHTRLLTLYRARQGRRAVGGVMHVQARDGYNGTIDLLVGLREDGSISGVRVAAHHETPGLGDAIELTKSDWITQFRNRSLTYPGPPGWRVRRDGGEFDQLTGATVTARAVTRSVHDALLYFDAHRDSLLAAPTSE